MTYHFIPEAKKQLVLRMSLQGMMVKEIMNATGMDRMTIFRIRSNCKCTGGVICKSLKNGRPRILLSLNGCVVQAMEGAWRELWLKGSSAQVRTRQCTKPYNLRNRHSVLNGLSSWGPLNPQIRGYYIGNYTVCQRIQIQGMPRVPGG